jgi:hypothetical protein
MRVARQVAGRPSAVRSETTVCASVRVVWVDRTAALDTAALDTAALDPTIQSAVRSDVPVGSHR